MPRAEIDDWLDCPDQLNAHLFALAHRVGNAIRRVLGPPRVGLIVAGFEVPHVHVHVFGAGGLGSFDFSRAGNATQEQLEPVAARLREAMG